MAAAELSRALHRLIGNRQRALRFRDGDDAAAFTDELDGDERAALAARDLPRLYALGAHPILLFHLSAILYARAHYVANVVPKLQGVPNPYYDYYQRFPATQAASGRPLAPDVATANVTVVAAPPDSSEVARG